MQTRLHFKFCFLSTVRVFVGDILIFGKGVRNSLFIYKDLNLEIFWGDFVTVFFRLLRFLSEIFGIFFENQDFFRFFKIVYEDCFSCEPLAIALRRLI